MKRMYSAILLFSFFIGMLQPILPMIDYQLHRGSLLELFSSDEEAPEILYDGVLYTTNDDTDPQQGDSEQSLLDDDYYPLGIQNAAIPSPHNFPHTGKLYLPIIEYISGPSYLPIPPPPRLS